MIAVLYTRYPFAKKCPWSETLDVLQHCTGYFGLLHIFIARASKLLIHQINNSNLNFSQSCNVIKKKILFAVFYEFLRLI